MAARTVLVTAFEPFGGDAVNASSEAARRIDGLRSGETVVTALALPCVYGACVAELLTLVERLRPCAVLMTGQAAARGIVSVERLARNRAHATARDNSGLLGSTADDGPDWIETTAPARAIARAIRDIGVPARVSSDAGDYVCNHLYYNALRYLALQIPAVFIHLPATPGQSPSGTISRRLASAAAGRALGAAAGILAAGGLAPRTVRPRS